MTNSKGLCVSVFMVAYNHEKYVAQAIESVIRQKGDFSIRLIIGEDCSTDSTLSICQTYKEKYPDKIELLANKTNLGSSKNVANVYRRCVDSGAEYVAILEGDDYWTDDYKLSKQIEILENNSNYSFCFTNVAHLIEKSNSFLPVAISEKSNREIDLDHFLINGCYIPTLSVVFRARFYPSQMPDWFLKVIKQDWFVFLCLFRQGNAFYLNEVTGVYRVHTGGVMHTKRIILLKNNLFLVENTRNYLAPNYSDLFANIISSHADDLAFEYLGNLEFADFFKYMIQAVRSGDEKPVKWYYLRFRRVISLLKKIITKSGNPVQ